MPHTEQPSKPALAVGQVWRCRDGTRTTLKEQDKDGAFQCCFGYWYAQDGKSYTDDAGAHIEDVELIELISGPEPEPASTQCKIMPLVCKPKGTSSYVDLYQDLMEQIWDHYDTARRPAGELISQPAPVKRLFDKFILHPLEPYMYAVADDGTAWVSSQDITDWKQIAPLPDREVPNA